jgi:hypothetical protein
MGSTAYNAGYLEIATADDGTEPIYARQYTGVFATVARTLTLLDGSGNSNFPGSIQTNANGIKWDESGVRSWNMFPTGGGLRTTSGDGAGWLDVTMSGGIRSPIYYDYNDTGYYADPSSTSWGFYSAGGGRFRNIQISDSTYTDTIQHVTSGSNLWLQYGHNGPVGLCYGGGNVGVGTLATAAAKLHVRVSTPTGIGTLPSGVSMISDSSTNNYLLFRNTGDNATYSGIAMQDNNVGGYVIFGNAGGGGDLLYVAGYGGGQLQYGTADSIDRTARTTVASWNSTGLQVNNGDFRAPIFYDSDNTAYYMNPAGNSYLNSTYFDFAPSSVYFRITTGPGTFYIGDDDIAVLGSSASARSPIFYDYNDTNYYCDPNGTSHFSIVTSDTGIYAVNGWWTFADDSRNPSDAAHYPTAKARGVRFSFASASYTGTGGNYSGVMHFAPWEGTTSSTGDASYQLAFGSTATNGGGTPQLVLRKGIDSTWNSWYYIPMYGVNAYTSSFYATILYDSNDTGYYVDPNSTSNIYKLNVGGPSSQQLYVSGLEADVWLYSSSTNSTWRILGATGATTHRFRIYDQSAGAERFYINSSGNVYATVDFRAPIFYDSDNTGYYVNPNGQSNLCGTAFECSASTGRGTYGKALANLLLNASVANGTGYACIDFRSGGNYPSDGAQIYYESDMNGNSGAETSRLTIRCENDADDNILIRAGYITINSTTVDGGSTSPGFRTQYNGTARIYTYSDNTTEASSFRAPIFYDSENTAYYADPTSTSAFVGLTVTNTISGSVSGSSGSTTGNAATATILKAVNVTSSSASTWNPGSLTYQAWGQAFGHSSISADTGDITLWLRPSQYSGGGTEVNMYIDGDFYSGSGAYKVLNAGNYTSYSPSLTGSGASGNWGINVTGTASNITAYTINQSVGTGNSPSFTGATFSSGNVVFSNSGTTKRGVFGTCGDNDFWFVGGGATASNSGYLEIATGDDGQTSGTYEQIYVSQYGPGDPLTGTLQRRAKLLDENGNTIFPQNITAYSDERLKTNWRDMPDNFVTRLAKVKVGIYDRTDQINITQVGVGAQSLQEVLPEAIVTANDDFRTLSVNYGGAALASAVELAKEVVDLKELSTKQQKQIEDQKSEISELKSMINMLVDKVNKLVD